MPSSSCRVGATACWATISGCGTVPDRVLLKQDGLPIDMRDLDLELQLMDTALLPMENIAVLRVISQAGLDAASPLAASTLPITRSKGIVYPERIAHNVDFTYRLPAEFYTAPQGDDASWRGTWKSRKAELLTLLAGLALLAGALAWQKRLVRDGRQFAWFRRLFLVFLRLASSVITRRGSYRSSTSQASSRP